MSEPKGAEGAHHGRVIDELQRFDQKGIGPELIGAIDVHDISGGSEDNNAQGFKAGLTANPLEQFEAVHFWHFEIEKNEVREWKFFAPGIFEVALEIGDGLLAVADNMEGIMDFCLG